MLTGRQADKGSATGGQSGRQGFSNRWVVRQARVQRQAVSQAGEGSATTGKQGDGRRTKGEGGGLPANRENEQIFV